MRGYNFFLITLLYSIFQNTVHLGQLNYKDIFLHLGVSSNYNNKKNNKNNVVYVC